MVSSETDLLRGVHLLSKFAPSPPPPLARSQILASMAQPRSQALSSSATPPPLNYNQGGKLKPCFVGSASPL